MSTHAEIAERVGKDFTSGLLDALPRLADAMQTGQAQSSFSVTLQIHRSRKGRLNMALKPRERIPIEPIEYDVHLDDGQLALGIGEHEEEESAEE